MTRGRASRSPVKAREVRMPTRLPRLPDRLVALLDAVRHKSYFDCLGIPMDASTTDVRDAYRRLVAELDEMRQVAGLYRGMREALDEVAHVIEDAFEVLSDPDLRLAYRRALQG